MGENCFLDLPFLVITVFKRGCERVGDGLELQVFISVGHYLIDCGGQIPIGMVGNLDVQEGEVSACLYLSLVLSTAL